MSADRTLDTASSQGGALQPFPLEQEARDYEIDGPATMPSNAGEYLPLPLEGRAFSLIWEPQERGVNRDCSLISPRYRTGLMVAIAPTPLRAEYVF